MQATFCDGCGVQIKGDPQAKWWPDKARLQHSGTLMYVGLCLSCQENGDIIKPNELFDRVNE